MYIRIRDAGRKPNGNLYIHSDQWESRSNYDAGEIPIRCNSYETNRVANHSQIVRDGNGNYIAEDGRIFASRDETTDDVVWAREEYTIDLEAELLVSIKQSFVSMIGRGLTGCYCGDRCAPLYLDEVLIGSYIGPDNSVVPENILIEAEIED